MAKFPEAEARIMRGMFVCRRCKTKIRAQGIKVVQKKVACRKCNSKVLRPVRKK